MFTDAADALDLGEEIDVVFDLTGVPAIRAALRQKLQETGNQHTVIAPEVVVRFFWTLFEDDARLSGPVRAGY